jgi:hypothetical protein
MKSGKALQDTLLKIQNGENYDIWKFLPNGTGGQSWRVEMLDGARMLSEWVDPEKNYDLPDLQDAANKIASNEAEDYYAVINQRVQDLALWAYNEVDELVQELFPHSVSDQPTLKDLNSRYLIAGMSMLLDAIADQAYLHTEGGDE